MDQTAQFVGHRQIRKAITVRIAQGGKHCGEVSHAVFIAEYGPARLKHQFGVDQAGGQILTRTPEEYGGHLVTD